LEGRTRPLRRVFFFAAPASRTKTWPITKY
jgi:hypothetical protein